MTSQMLIYHLMQSQIISRLTRCYHECETMNSNIIKTQNGDENSIINWIYDGDRLKTGDEDDIVTVEDVKRKMEMLHLNR